MLLILHKDIIFNLKSIISLTLVAFIENESLTQQNIFSI